MNGASSKKSHPSILVRYTQPRWPQCANEEHGAGGQRRPTSLNSQPHRSSPLAGPVMSLTGLDSGAFSKGPSRIVSAPELSDLHGPTRLQVMPSRPLPLRTKDDAGLMARSHGVRFAASPCVRDVKPRRMTLGSMPASSSLVTQSQRDRKVHHFGVRKSKSDIAPAVPSLPQAHYQESRSPERTSRKTASGEYEHWLTREPSPRGRVRYLLAQDSAQSGHREAPLFTRASIDMQKVTMPISKRVHNASRQLSSSLSTGTHSELVTPEVTDSQCPDEVVISDSTDVDADSMSNLKDADFDVPICAVRKSSSPLRPDGVLMVSQEKDGAQQNHPENAGPPLPQKRHASLPTNDHSLHAFGVSLAVDVRGVDVKPLQARIGAHIKASPIRSAKKLWSKLLIVARQIRDR